MSYYNYSSPITESQRTIFRPLQRLSGMTISVNYADFLDHTLQANLHHFDDFVVVTSYEDIETQEVCRKHSINCVETDVFYQDGDGLFNKGMGINLGLAHLKATDWIIHLDADIVLPDRFRNMLSKQPLERKCIYGADRVMVRSYEEWAEFYNGKFRQYSYNYLVKTPEQFPLGARVVHNDFGWTPLGYFQLFHRDYFRRYPTSQTSAEHTDLLFSCQWRRECRKLLPEIIVYHLDSEKSKMGTNWSGRKTKRFGRG